MKSTATQLNERLLSAAPSWVAVDFIRVLYRLPGKGVQGFRSAVKAGNEEP
jgi:hypothetical protein